MLDLFRWNLGRGYDLRAGSALLAAEAVVRPMAHNPKTGGWEPAVPLPFFGRSILGRRRYICWEPVPTWPYGVLTKSKCGQRFKTRDDYERHYRSAHLEQR